MRVKIELLIDYERDPEPDVIRGILKSAVEHMAANGALTGGSSHIVVDSFDYKIEFAPTYLVTIKEVYNSVREVEAWPGEDIKSLASDAYETMCEYDRTLDKDSWMVEKKLD